MMDSEDSPAVGPPVPFSGATSISRKCWRTDDRLTDSIDQCLPSSVTEVNSQNVTLITYLTKTPWIRATMS